jgi:putative lipoprotein (rSAM/lipoprotein system)
MNKKFIKLFDKVILAVLGFSGIVYSCAKYGEPIADFEVNGIITDKTTAKPIQGIRISKEKSYDGIDTMYTSSEGRYVFHNWNNQLHLKIEDIDGEANGGYFETQEIDVTFTNADLIKGRGNKKPDKYVKVLNIGLTKKELPVSEYGVPQVPFKQ